MRIPVVLVHGHWVRAEAWGRWVEPLNRAGFEPIVLAWPKESNPVEGATRTAEVVGTQSVAAFRRYLKRALGSFAVQPFVVGHGVAGLTVQELANMGHVAVGVTIAPLTAPLLRGLEPAAAQEIEHLVAERGRTAPVTLTQDQFNAFYASARGQTISPQSWARYALPSSLRHFSDLLSRPEPTRSRIASPSRLLFVHGSEDRFVSPRSVGIAAQRHGGSTAIIEGAGHGLYFDASWEHTSAVVLDWLIEQRASQ